MSRGVARWIAAGVLALAILVGGWFGYRALNRDDAAVPASTVVAQEIPAGPAATDGVETIDTGTTDALTGGTPMAQRVAVVGLLNKRNGIARDLTLKPGQAVRIGDVVVRLRACEKTAPWEQEALTGAFVQLDIRGADRAWRRTFAGWLFKERPGLNVVRHPVYDVWTKSCTMSWPATGPDTTSLGGPAPASSARKSAGARAEDAPEEEPTAPSSAPASNAT